MAQGTVDVVELDASTLSLRRDTLTFRRCKRCGSEWPGYLERCRHCPGVLGKRFDRQIVIVAPEVAHGDLAGLVTPAAALALEMSGEPYHAESLRSEARMLLGQVWAALPATVAVWTEPSGVLVAVLADGSLAENAAVAARGAVALEHCDRLEWRAGLAIGLIDGSEPRCAEVVKRAGRLARAADAGQTLAGYGTARLLDYEWEFAPRGLLARREEDVVEGATTLIGHKHPAPTPSALAPDSDPGLVGREAELAALDSDLQRVRNGETRWRAITAAAGGGKSKLLRTWLGRHERARVSVIGAAGSPFGQSPRALVDRLLDALGAPLAADVPVADVLAALANALECEMRQRPVVVMIDDLHWADTDSLALLRKLSARRLPGCLFVIALRSSFVPSAAWLMNRADLIALPPLCSDERDRLLRRLLPSETDAQLRATLAAAPQGGNPLYLEHAAAYLHEAGPSAPLPKTLHEAVLSRLELVRARVYRRGYDLPSPKDLATIEQMVGEWLDRLETGDYEDRATIAEYLSLLENIDAGLVIAGSLAGVPQKRNRRLAAAVERFYSASVGERLDALQRLAKHKPANAAHAAARGAEQATAKVRLKDAAGFLELAQRLTHAEERSRHLLALGDILLVEGELQRAAHAYVAAGRANPNDPFLARCERRLARVALAQDDPDTALTLLEHALPRLTGHDRPVATCDLAYVQALVGDPKRAERTLRLEEPAAELPELRAMLLRTKLRMAVLKGETDLETLAGQCASSLLLEGEPVADLAALVETTLLLNNVLPHRAGASLIMDAKHAANRLENAAAQARLDNHPHVTAWEPLHFTV